MSTLEEQLLEEEIQKIKDFSNKDSISYKFGIGLIESDIKDAQRLNKLVTLFKLIVALLVVISYFYFQDWLFEIMVVAVIISLISPDGFFSVFIQKLLEYNTQITENRQRLNALESNKQFSKIYKKLDELK